MIAEQILLLEEAPALEVWRAQAARMELLTSDASIGRSMEASIDAIQAVARAGHLLRVAFSGGKDSTLLASLTLEALRRMKEDGEPVVPVHLVSAETGIENPEVTFLMHMHHQGFCAQAAAIGIEARSQITRPRLSERWWVGIIGGTSLPSFFDTKADCSTDMKVSPLSRLAKSTDAALDRAGKPRSVTVIGTRFDESARRRAAMNDRGESISEIRTSDVGGHKALTLSPICLWPTETVWAYLQRAGIGKQYPGYLKDYSQTWSLYDAASAGECVVYGGETQKRASGCGARLGCQVCLRVQRDQSLENMIMLDEYAYLRPMSQLRQYLFNTRFDFTRRRWLTRRVDSEGDGLMLAPNTYSAAECARLLRMVLTIDQRERKRASLVDQQLRNGKIPRTAHNERMSRPQFLNLDLESLLAIDYSWSLNVMAPTHAALRIAKEVWSGEGEMEVPVISPFPRIPVPAGIPLPADPHLWKSQMGARDALEEFTRCEHVSQKTAWRDDESWSIDEESAGLFFDLEMERRLEETVGQGPEMGLAAAEYYLRMGIVAYPARSAYLLDRMKRRAGYLAAMGLAGEAADGPQAVNRFLARREAA